MLENVAFSDEDVVEFFNGLDKNEDGRISREEFARGFFDVDAAYGEGLETTKAGLVGFFFLVGDNVYIVGRAEVGEDNSY